MTTQITSINAPEIKRRKAALESKIEELLEFSLEREELQIEPLADPIDQVRSNVDRDVAVQRIDHQAHLVDDIRSALTKIEENSYGVCEQCEEAIPGRRLDAIPWARLCVPCQSEKEGAERGGKMASQNAARGPRVVYVRKPSNIAA